MPQITPKYITLDDAIRIVNQWSGVSELQIEGLTKLPAADVIPVVHGKWKTDAKFTNCIYARCSECNTVQIFYYGKSFTKYCPECGVKMDGDKND